MSVVVAACVVLGSLSAGLLAVAAWLWASRHRTSIPGPPTLPLLGNALTFYKLPVLWDRLGELHSRYGDTFRIYIGPKLVIVLTQPEDVQSLMLGSKAREREPYVMSVFRTFLGDGLLTINGEKWKRHRKYIEPAFHAEELEKFVDKFNDVGCFLCEQLAKKKGTELELYHPLVMTTCYAAIATIFNLQMERFFPGQHQLADVVDVFTHFGETFPAILYRPWTAINLIRWMTPEGRTLTRYKNTLRNMIDRGFDLASKKLDGLKASERTILTLLLTEKKSKATFTDQELHDEATTLATASAETTASTMGYIFTLLGLYPEWQDLAQRELDNHFGAEGDYLRRVTIADLAQLKVIDAIVKECGRLFPTVPCLPYVVPEDLPLAGSCYVAPRGSTALIASFLMHRHPKLFPEPDKFDPGRFLEGGSATTRKAYSYVPFGLGARKCVGARYAVLQMKVILATVLRRYRILPGTSREELEESVLSIIAHPVTGFRVTFVSRDNVPSK